MSNTKFDPQKPFDNAQDRHHCRSIRLQGYDYSQAGAYYVPIVTYHRDCLFGDVVNGEMVLNDFGKIADECWRAIPKHFPFVELGSHIVMPNHAHGIIVIHNDESPSNVGATHWVVPTTPDNRPKGPKPKSLGAIIGSFKSAVSYRINKEYNATGIWQRNFVSRVLCGITNTLFVMKKTCKTKPITSKRIPHCGMMTRTTQLIHCCNS